MQSEMHEDDTCEARVHNVVCSASLSRQQRQKLDVRDEVIRRLKELNSSEVTDPNFYGELCAHFNRLPTRYALDVNVERAEDVLLHKRLLQVAHNPACRPALDVRLVQVSAATDGNSAGYTFSDSSVNEVSRNTGQRPIHEITFSSDDKPKLLSQLSSLFSEIGLNIQEAHVFSTIDGYSLDVFVVDGWPCEETEHLKLVLETEIAKFEKHIYVDHVKHPSTYENEEEESRCIVDHVEIPNDGFDVWEINCRHLKLETKVASGSYGDLYKGTYYNQEVAVKTLKPDYVSVEMQREFAHEVYIMRKIRHKNIVQFIGACTRPPNLCIVTEFMRGGSLYDFLHKRRGNFKILTLLKVAVDVSKGMHYLHQNNIIHRDLKAANLLIDENDVVKVADFGVARVRTQTGIMTAETGTYRWMAPEVIEHKPYDHKADVFSFGITLWELLTGKVPYEYLTPLQAAMGVVQKGLRPTVPKHAHPRIAALLHRCWQSDPCLRPAFSEIMDILHQILVEVTDDCEDRRESFPSRFLSVLRKASH